jgi:hypothetical protein
MSSIWTTQAPTRRSDVSSRGIVPFHDFQTSKSWRVWNSGTSQPDKSTFESAGSAFVLKAIIETRTGKLLIGKPVAGARRARERTGQQLEFSTLLVDR